MPGSPPPKLIPLSSSHNFRDCPPGLAVTGWHVCWLFGRLPHQALRPPDLGGEERGLGRLLTSHPEVPSDGFGASLMGTLIPVVLRIEERRGWRPSIARRQALHYNPFTTPLGDMATIGHEHPKAGSVDISASNALGIRNECEQPRALSTAPQLSSLKAAQRGKPSYRHGSLQSESGTGKWLVAGCLPRRLQHGHTLRSKHRQRETSLVGLGCPSPDFMDHNNVMVGWSR